MANDTEDKEFLNSLSQPRIQSTFIDNQDGKNFIKKVTTTSNTDVELLITNRDKLELALRKYEEALKNRLSWTTPFGIFISLLVTCITSDSFKPFLGLSSVEWKAIVIVSCIGSLIWLVIMIIKMCRSWGKAELNTIINNLMKKNG